MSRENVALVQRSIELWNRGDVDVYMALFADDAEFVTDPQFLEGGTHKGREAIAVFLRGLHEGWAPGDSVVPTDIRDAGDKVFLSWDWQATGSASGLETSSHWNGVITFRGGEAIRFEIFADRAGALAAAGLA